MPIVGRERLMATTIDIPCPKCGELVCCDYLKGWFHEFMFFRLMRTSFRLDCPCGMKKTYFFLSPSKLESMYGPEDNETEISQP